MRGRAAPASGRAARALGRCVCTRCGLRVGLRPQLLTKTNFVLFTNSAPVYLSATIVSSDPLSVRASGRTHEILSRSAGGGAGASRRSPGRLAARLGLRAVWSHRPCRLNRLGRPRKHGVGHKFVVRWARGHASIHGSVGSVVADTTHKAFRIRYLPVETCTREVEARVFGLKALEHERLLHLRLCERIIYGMTLE